MAEGRGRAAAESQIWVIERAALRLEAALVGLESRATEVDQKIRELWFLGIGAPTCTLFVRVTRFGAAFAGASVTIRAGSASGAIVASGTTDDSGFVELAIPGAGVPYHVAASGACGTVAGVVTPPSCGAQVDRDLVANPALLITVYGCLGLRLPGATATVNGVAYPTDGQGVARVPVVPGVTTYSGTIAHPKFLPQAFSETLPACASRSISKTLAPAAGTHCFCNCPLPVPDVLNLIDPIHGPIGLHWVDSVRTWTASRVVPAPGRLKAPPPGGMWYEGCSTDAVVDVPIVYQVGCAQGRQPLLNVLYAECQKIFPFFEVPRLSDAPDNVDFSGWPLSPSGAAGSTTVYQCAPLDYSVSITFEGNGLQLYPPGPHLFRVFE